MDGIAGKGASREPEPVDAGIVEAGEPYGRTRSHVLLQGTQHHHRGRGVQHVVGGDVELVVHRLVHTVHTPSDFGLGSPNVQCTVAKLLKIPIST